MKNLLGTLLLLTAISNAQAQTFVYEIYHDYNDTMSGVEVEIEFYGPFKMGSQLKTVKVTDVKGAVPIPLFDLNEKQVLRYFDAVWLDETTVHIVQEDGVFFPSVVEESYMRGHMDVPIEKGDRHILGSSFEHGFRLTVDGTFSDDYFEISSDRWEEMNLSGALKRVR
jgi:hypothetical protein